MVAVRPKMKSTSEKLLGKNVLVFLNYGEAASEESPKWTLIGGQRSADYSASAEEIDLTDKTSGGYGDAEAGVKSTELTVELIVTSMEETAAHDDAAILSVTLKGKGAPKTQDAMEDPRG